MWLRRKENIWITEVIKSESLGLCHQDNGNTIIRDASADWLSALAGVQSAQKITKKFRLFTSQGSTIRKRKQNGY
ncbi:PREDICTED: uncharacterized protein LOC105151059 isoform X2 [Acromyrmex echinatior]|uniref:uncharacterized protein LOC105151059 isoform X2 n=1 Tax=Acromyrmex echinatior TaxID=103372 RepID=UPI000580DDD4|nr:PREDICTED: uncharacterized protein LOC105151059 isoform X2 [Acromyrmex echinatior]